MDKFQLERYCTQHPYCDCNCIKCAGFGSYHRHELGLDERDEDYEDYCLKQEILETTCDDIGF